MSVSDPMIKDLKGSAVHFLGVSQPVTDDTEAVRTFCEALERILLRGLLVRINAFGYWRDPEPWHWLEKLSFKKFGAPYLYQLSVEKVRKCEKVRTNTGRTRLLIRHCLNNRCLHIPFQLLLETKQYKLVYGRESVLGSDILAQILMSVVLLPSRLQFKLDTDNSRFLDDAWLLPTVRRLTFVPTDQLGISLTFVDGKAIAVEVLPDSVASEDEQVEVGDVLDELNSVVIIAGLQGCMGQVLRKSAGHPITAYVIKAKHKGTLYGPLVPLLRRAGLSTTQVLSGSISSISESKQAMTYMGHVLTADRGDVKEIKQAIRQLLGEHQETEQVLLDCHDMGVTVTRVDNSRVLMKHSYMQISSCGCTVQAPNYFAYIAEDRSISPDNRFVCYIFHTENQDLIDNTLTSIGQGFKRTHFAV
uniref:RUN domain-containing protein n=1 Tax=Cuerna arida TaxID=1464854 RepID=A0A1B6F5G7_9HEMI